jgi:hypothetical protein
VRDALNHVTKGIAHRVRSYRLSRREVLAPSKPGMQLVRKRQAAQSVFPRADLCHCPSSQDAPTQPANASSQSPA